MLMKCRRIMPDSKSRLLLVIILFTGLSLRLLYPESIGIDHFDEGIYALAGQWIYEPNGLANLDPGMIPYGPPITSFTMGVSYLILGGPSDFAAILPGILFGTISIFLIFLLAKSIFGIESGLISAALLATSGMAIAFSRSALTDAPLMCIWLLSMIAGLQFLKMPGLKTSFMMGLTVGLAQLTKYNGAMTGVVIALTAILDFICSCRNPTSETKTVFLKRIGWGLFSVCIAVAIYWPWFQFIDAHGGYFNLMKHHSGYVSPLAKWPSNLRLQWLQAWTFHQQVWPKIIMTTLTLAIFSHFSRLKVVELGNIEFTTLIIRKTVMLAFILFIPHSIWPLSIILVPKLWANREPGKRLAAVWFVFMSLITPCYHPYARLWLPTILASFVIVPVILNQDESTSLTNYKDKPRFLRNQIFKLCVTGFLLILISLPICNFDQTRSASELPDIWSGRAGLRKEVSELVPKLTEKLKRGQQVSMLISPAARWQLQRALLQQDLGSGRLASLSDLSDFQLGKGPLFVDLSLITLDSDREKLRTIGVHVNTTQSDGAGPVNRGLITILDLRPDALIQRSHLPDMHLELLD